MPTKKRIKNKHKPRGIKIIYEDRDIIVADKVAGLLTMGTDKEKVKTAYYALTNYVKKGNAKSRCRVFIVHRLDRDTSGIIIFAKHYKAKMDLQRNWNNIEKTYLAIVEGKMGKKEGLITSYLAQNKSQVVYSTPNKSIGKLSKTRYKVTRQYKGLNLLEINPLTGRKNQIRVHLADEGHPVLGDKKYGYKGRYYTRLALHAKSLGIQHPFTGKNMTFCTEMPDYFKKLLNA